jgi:hypothetical protein
VKVAASLTKLWLDQIANVVLRGSTIETAFAEVTRQGSLHLHTAVAEEKVHSAPDKDKKRTRGECLSALRPADSRSNSRPLIVFIQYLSATVRVRRREGCEGRQEGPRVLQLQLPQRGDGLRPRPRQVWFRPLLLQLPVGQARQAGL